MKKKFTRKAVAATLVGGIALGSIAAPPMAAFAADTSTTATATATARTPGQWVTDALKDLVAQGTLTQDQSNAVASALQDARPTHGPGHGPQGRPG